MLHNKIKLLKLLLLKKLISSTWLQLRKYSKIKLLNSFRQMLINRDLVLAKSLQGIQNALQEKRDRNLEFKSLSEKTTTTNMYLMMMMTLEMQMNNQFIMNHYNYQVLEGNAVYFLLNRTNLVSQLSIPRVQVHQQIHSRTCPMFKTKKKMPLWRMYSNIAKSLYLLVLQLLRQCHHHTKSSKITSIKSKFTKKMKLLMNKKMIISSK